MNKQKRKIIQARINHKTKYCVPYFGAFLDLSKLKRLEFDNCVRFFDENNRHVLREVSSCSLWSNSKYTKIKDSTISVTNYENSEGFCSERSFKDRMFLLSYKNSKGRWFKYTRDEEGNLLTREDNDGLITYLAGDKVYGLHYKDGIYRAGCRYFTYDEAIEHWSGRSTHFDEIKNRAVKFLAAIEKHNQELKGN